jgi:hypothetical protein
MCSAIRMLLAESRALQLRFCIDHVCGERNCALVLQGARTDDPSSSQSQGRMIVENHAACLVAVDVERRENGESLPRGDCIQSPLVRRPRSEVRYSTPSRVIACEI